MVNTGTWDSDLAFIFIVLFFLPLFLHMVFGCIARAKHLTEKPYVINIYEEVETGPILKTAPVARQSSPAPVDKPKPKTKTEPDTISLDAISGLIGLGYKKSEARRLVAVARSQKHYEKAEDIIMDTMANCV